MNMLFFYILIYPHTSLSVYDSAASKTQSPPKRCSLVICRHYTTTPQYFFTSSSLLLQSQFSLLCQIFSRLPPPSPTMSEQSLSPIFPHYVVLFWVGDCVFLRWRLSQLGLISDSLIRIRLNARFRRILYKLNFNNFLQIK